MAKRAAKPVDINQRAAAVVAHATGTGEQPKEKNAAAVELGKLGGQARAAQFKTKRQRQEAASIAAKARWERYRQAKENEAQEA